jgi:hypothetical protein
MLFAVLVVAGVVTSRTGGAASGPVLLDGTPLPNAVSTIRDTVDVTEFREGTGDPCAIRLLPGCAHHAVCIETPAPVATLEAGLVPPGSAMPGRFAVTVEDGRTFASCVLTGLTTDGAGRKRRYSYCFRCEGATLPAF